MSLPRKSVESTNYYFDIVTKNKKTYSVQIHDSNAQIIADLPLDPMDNTLAAVLSENIISRLGKDAGVVLNALSKYLQEEIGAKQFIVIPNGTAIPDYLPAQDAEFKRLRHASRIELEKSSAIILEQYKELAAELDNEYEIVLGIKDLENKLSHNKPYEEIYALLNKHANFTPDKMNEYKEEEIEGAKARYNNKHVNTIAMVNKQNRLCGIMRSLAMGNKFAYLSDEVINQEILPLEKFQGNTDAEQVKNRSKFLLAYLTNKHCSLETDQDHILLIAPDGRVDIYEDVGLKKLPLEDNDYVVTMKLSQPALSLKNIKEELCKPSFSNAAVMSNMGILSSPMENIIDDQQLQVTIKYNQ